MPHKKRKFILTQHTIEARKARSREVRDLYNKLRKKYNSAIIDEFFRQNYFLQPRTVEIMIRESDNEPVTNPSLIYRQAMDETFYI